MSNLNITELSNLATSDQIALQIIPADSITATQKVALAAASNSSAAFQNPPQTLSPINAGGQKTRFVVLVAGANCVVAFGASAPNNAVTQNGTILIAGVPQIFAVQPGWFVSAATATP